MTWEGFPFKKELKLEKQTALGVMNVVEPRLLDIYLTLGAGSAVRTRGRMPAIEPDGHGGAVFRGIQNLNKDDGNRNAEPGLLGELLKRKDIRVCLIDSGSEPLLPVLMLMDKNGRVPRVAAGKELLKETKNGVRSNHGAMMAAFKSMYGECGIIVVRDGNLTRAVKKYGEKSRDAALEWLPTMVFFEDIISSINRDNTLIFQVGLPIDESEKTPGGGRMLSPVAIQGPGIPEAGGAITTDTTRFPYLCTSIDIMPSILKVFGIRAPENITGREVYIKHQGAGIGNVLEVNRRAATTDRFRHPGQFANSVLYLLLVFLSAIMLRRSGSGAPGRGLRFSIKLIALVLMLFPAVCILFTPVLSNGMSIFESLIVSLGISLAGALLLYGAFRGGPWAVCVALGFTVALICADISFGWGLNRYNIFGFSVLLGKRFYGLGNECVAVLVGALVMGAPLLLDRAGLRGRAASLFVCAIFLPGIFFIGLPTLGANAGGTMTAAITAVAVVFGVTGRRITLVRLLLMLLTCLFFVGLFLIVDWMQGAERGTHIAHTILQARASGSSLLGDVVARKVRIQLFVLFSTVYGYCLALMIGIVMWVYHRKGSRLRAMLEASPMLGAGAGASLWAATAGFVFNDSGLPFAALILGFAASVVCYFVPEFGNDSKP